MLYTWTGTDPFKLGPFEIAPGESVDVEFPPADPGFVEGDAPKAQPAAPVADEKPAPAVSAPVESVSTLPAPAPVSSPADDAASAPTATTTPAPAASAPPITSTVVSA